MSRCKKLATLLNFRNTAYVTWLDMQRRDHNIKGSVAPRQVCKKNGPKASGLFSGNGCLLRARRHGAGGFVAGSILGRRNADMGADYVLLSVAVVVIGGTQVSGGAERVRLVSGARPAFLFLINALLNATGAGAGLWAIVYGLLIVGVTAVASGSAAARLLDTGDSRFSLLGKRDPLRSKLSGPQVAITDNFDAIVNIALCIRLSFRRRSFIWQRSH